MTDDPKMYVPIPGICKCEEIGLYRFNEIKHLEMRRLPWIIFLVSKFHHKYFYKREAKEIIQIEKKAE